MSGFAMSAGPTRAQMWWARLVLVICFLLVGGPAAAVSFFHIRDVAVIGHQSLFMAYLYPLTVDGVMGIASVAMWQDKVFGRHVRPWATFSFWIGLGVSLLANVTSEVSVWGWGLVGIAVAAWPPVGLLVSVEIVSKPGRARSVAETIAQVRDAMRIPSARPDSGQPAGTPADASAASDAGRAQSQPGVDSVGTRDGGRDVRPASNAALRRGRPLDDEPLPDDLVALALQVGRAWRERTGNVITRDGLRAQLRDKGWQRGISNVTAGRLLALIADNDHATVTAR